MAAPKDNRFAAKPQSQKFSSSLSIRMTPEEKQACVEAAGGTNFSAWARRALLDAAAATAGEPTVSNRP